MNSSTMNNFLFEVGTSMISIRPPCQHTHVEIRQHDKFSELHLPKAKTKLQVLWWGGGDSWKVINSSGISYLGKLFS